MCPLYEFVCTDGHVTEALRSSGVTSIPCACGQVAQRRGFNRVSATIGAEADWSSPVRDGTRIRPPVSERKIKMREFNEATAQLSYEHARIEDSMQRVLAPPPLARTAIRRAQQLMAGGINDSIDLAKVTK